MQPTNTSRIATQTAFWILLSRVMFVTVCFILVQTGCQDSPTGPALDVSAATQRESEVVNLLDRVDVLTRRQQWDAALKEMNDNYRRYQDGARVVLTHARLREARGEYGLAGD